MSSPPMPPQLQRWRGRLCRQRLAARTIAWAAMAAVASLLCPAGAALVGPAYVVELSQTEGLQVAALGGDDFVICYFDVGASYVARCEVLAADAGVAAAPTSNERRIQVHTQVGPATIAVAGLDSSRAIVCYGFQFLDGTCRVLTSSSSALSMGVATTFAENILYLSMAALSSDRVVACYYDETNSAGACSVLSAAGTTVASNASLVVNPGATGYVSVSAVDADRAVVCYQDGAELDHGRCAVIVFDSATNALSKGPDFVIQSSPIRSTGVATMRSDSVGVCYDRISASTCKLLTVGGTSGDELSTGSPDVFIDNSALEVRVTALYRPHIDSVLLPGGGVLGDGGPDLATATVCYRKDALTFAMCNLLTADSDSSPPLTRDDAVTVVETDVPELATARLTSADAVVCYVDASASNAASCRIVDYAITTTTTTTTTTTSTTTLTTTTTSTTTVTTTSTTATTTTTSNPSQPPISGVVNLTFTDEDLRPGLYGGTLSWLRPLDFGPPVTKIAVYFAPDSDWVSTRVPLGLDLPEENTSSVEIPFGSDLANFSHLLVYTVNDDGRQTVPEFVAVHDVVRPLTFVQQLAFFDEDIDAGELAGTLMWAAPAEGVSYIDTYRVYIAMNDSIDDAELFQEVPVGVHSITLGTVAAPFSLGNWSHLGIYVANSDTEAVVGAWLEIVDRAVPVEGAQALSFTDEDLHADFIAGTFSWQHPDNNGSDIDFYVAFFSEDVELAVSQQIGANIPVNDSLDVAIGPAQATEWRAYFAVVAHNDIGPQRGVSMLPIADRGIDFEDSDLRRGLIGGAVAWWNGAGSPPDRLRVYLAEAPEASAAVLEVAPNMREVTFSGTHHFGQLLDLIVQDGDVLRLAADLTRPTPQSSDTVFAVAGSRVLRRRDFIGQPLNSMALPFTLVFGESFDPTSPSFDLADVDLGDMRYLHVSAEANDGASLGLRLGLIVDRAAPEYPAREVTFSDQDLERNKLGGFLRWEEPAEAPRFSLQFSGSCIDPVNETDLCAEAGADLGVGDGGGAMDDGQNGSPNDPPFCYYEGGALKFNGGGNNTGECRSAAPCLCLILDSDAPVLTRYAVYLADASNMYEGSRELLVEVDSNMTNATLQLGTRPWDWALVLVGSDDGFNEAIPAAVRLRDLAVYSPLRERLLARLSEAQGNESGAAAGA